MKPVILGNGILGKELTKQTGWDILSRSVDGIELTDITTWAHKLLPYDTIINCIANTNTYSDDRELHWNVNYKAVSELTEYCNNHGKKLVHISSDYVYANCKSIPSEKSVPVHQETYYAYTKLLADGYIELRSKNYLILRTTHKPTPFPYENAWVNQSGNFDYVDVIASLIIDLIKQDLNGVFNVGTEFKTMYHLAKKTKPDVKPLYNLNSKVPTNVIMDLTKYNNVSKISY